MTGSRIHRLGRVCLSARHGLDVTVALVDRGAESRERTVARCAVDVDAARRLAELLTCGADRVAHHDTTRTA